MEELLEIITWKQLGLYLNPIVILNVNGFFDPLLEMLEKAIDENFMRRQHGDIWKVAQTPEEAVELLYSTPVWDISIRKRIGDRSSLEAGNDFLRRMDLCQLQAITIHLYCRLR